MSLIINFISSFFWKSSNINEYKESYKNLQNDLSDKNSIKSSYHYKASTKRQIKKNSSFRSYLKNRYCNIKDKQNNHDFKKNEYKNKYFKKVNIVKTPKRGYYT